jgi:hypothetical protein
VLWTVATSVVIALLAALPVVDALGIGRVDYRVDVAVYGYLTGALLVLLGLAAVEKIWKP